MADANLKISGRNAVTILLQLVEKFPEFRVGQLLVVATNTIDIFNMENEELARRLNVLLWRDEPSKSG